MLDEFSEAITAIGKSDVRAVLVHAEGPDFSYGGDIVPWENMNQRELRNLFDRYLSTINLFEALPIPTVAAVHGLCFGGAFALVLRADIIIAGQTARFGHPEQCLGITTLLGGVYRVAERVGRTKAIEWAFTSEQVPAQVMEDFGIVNRVVEDDKLFEEALAYTHKLANGPTLVHSVHKNLLRIWASGGVAAADHAVLEMSLPLFESDDAKRLALPGAIEAFKAGKPRPVFPFKGR